MTDKAKDSGIIAKFADGVNESKPVASSECNGAGFATFADGDTTLPLLRLAHELVSELCLLCNNPIHKDQKAEIEAMISQGNHPQKSANDGSERFLPARKD